MRKGTERDILPIPDTPDNVAKIILSKKPKKEWQYIKRKQKQTPINKNTCLGN